MKSTKLLALLLAPFLINSSLSFNLLIQNLQNNDKKLPNFVCKITKDITMSTNDTQDVLIGNVGGQVWSSTTNGIVRCLGNETSIVVTDFKLPLTEKRLRKASVVILIFGFIYQNTIQELVAYNLISSVWDHMAKFICIISSPSSYNQNMFILKSYSSFGFLNVALVYEVRNSIQSATLESVHGKMLIFSEISNGVDIFFDKLKNLNRYVYRIIVYDQPPRVILANDVITSPLIFYIAGIIKIQNASARISQLRNYNSIPSIWSKRQMDLTINTAASFPDDPNPKLMIYEENGYCALIPLPTKTSLTQLIFVKPFDGLTWLFLSISIAASVAVWWLFRNRGAIDSHWLLAYGFFVMFIGQGVEFTRKNRLVLAILLQLIILMVFVLNQAYEGVITSFMIQPFHENRIETFEQLLTTDFEVLTDEAFGRVLNSSLNYKRMNLRVNTSAVQLSYQFLGQIQYQHYVFIAKCDQAEDVIDIQLSNGKRVSEYYYILPHKIAPYFERLEASFLNPFILRLQYYMDLCFHAGLPKAWKLFTTSYQAKHQQHTEVFILRLKDLTQVFAILIVGYVIATVILLIEIFFHDCLKNLKLTYHYWKIKNIVCQKTYKKKLPRDASYQKRTLYYNINRHNKVKRLQPKKLKVRKIFVQPTNSRDN